MNQKYVLVLGKDNKLEYRAVKPGPLSGGLRVIREGVGDGDLVVVNGLQRVRPEMVVTPVHVALNGEPLSPNTLATAAPKAERRAPRATASAAIEGKHEDR